MKAAKQKKIKTIGFYGNKGGKCRDLTDLSIIVKSKNTANIQEALFLGHFILFPSRKYAFKKMKYFLVTGCAGFIGFPFQKKF